MATIREASGPFRHTWKTLPDTCKNYRCVTEDWDNLSKRKTYLLCDALDLNGNWKKSKMYLDENIKAQEDGMAYRTLPTYASNTLSSNLLLPNPRVWMMNGKLVLMAYGQGVNGPVWRSVTLHDLMNEDGVVFSSGEGLSPKGLAVRLAWIAADKAKAEAERIKREAARKELEPEFQKEWRALRRKEIAAMEEVRARLPPGAEIDWFKARIKDIQTEMAETMPEMPDSWLSKRIQQLSKQAEKVKKEAEKEDVKAVWKKCQKYVLTREVKRCKGEVRRWKDSPRNLPRMERSLKVAEEELAKFPSMSMPEGWWVHEGIRGILEEMEIEAIWVEEMKDALTFNIRAWKDAMKESENKPDKGYWYYAKEKLEKEEEELARLPDTPMPEGWQPDGWKSKL